MKLSEQLKDLFYFHESARKGILWLALLMAASVVFRIILPLLSSKETPDNLAIYQSWMASVSGVPLTSTDQEQLSVGNENFKRTEISELPMRPLFNPDTASLKTWMNYGLDRKQANTVVKYLKSGGQLRSRKDLLKIKIIDTSTFENISPFLDLPDSLEKRDYTGIPNEVKQSESLIIDINTADTAELKLLPGIGSYFARKIVEYRNRLGGFYDLEQIREVKGLKPETFDIIKPHVQVKAGTWKKIDVNGFDETHFNHPYLNKTQIRTLAAWREKHGPYVSAEQIKQAAMLSDSEIIKLLPYLPF
ncbi:MAG: hypothetical protein RL220_1543 [Bacteroidota bacterium]|jgi:competence ComEA-like helix-hairpin-helix protein